MKYTARQYAKILHKIIQSTEAKNLSPVIRDFIDILNDNNDLRLLNKIKLEFNKIFNEKEGIVEAEVTSAHTLSKDTLSRLREYFKLKWRARDIVFKEYLDDSLIGGFVVRREDKFYDFSIKNQTNQLGASLVG